MTRIVKSRRISLQVNAIIPTARAVGVLVGGDHGEQCVGEYREQGSSAARRSSAGPGAHQARPTPLPAWNDSSTVQRLPASGPARVADQLWGVAAVERQLTVAAVASHQQPLHVARNLREPSPAPRGRRRQTIEAHPVGQPDSRP
jgi:hypothetical protein